MAEKANLKIADQAAVAEDDPFAELTRIMGFDPRQPVKPAAAVAKPAEVKPAEPQIDEADFGIDLERELMGDFAAEEAPVAAYSPPAAAEEPVQAYAPKTADTTVAEVAPQAEAVAEEPGQQWSAPAEEAPAVEAEGVAEAAAEAEEIRVEDDAPVEAPIGFQAEGHEADSADQPAVQWPAVEELPLAEAEMTAPEPELHAAAPAEADEPAAEAAGEPVAEADHAPLAFADEGEPEAVEDAAAEPGIVETAAAERRDESVARPEIDEPVARAEIPEQDGTRAEAPGSSEWELDQHFDMAFADQPEHQPLAAVHHADEADASRSPVTDDVAEAAEETAYRLPLGAAFSPQPWDDGQVDRQPETVVPEASLETSLEEELNALLGNEPVAAADHHVSGGHDHAEPVQAAAPVAEPQPHWHDEPAMQAYDDGNAAAVDEEWLEPVDVAEVARQDQAWSSVAAPRHAEADDELDGLFDDQAFDAAISDAVAQAGDDTGQGEPAAAQTWEPEESMPRDGHDPYAALAAMSADLQVSRSWQHAPEPEQTFEPPAPAAAVAAARQEVPDIETVEVPEQAVALADDLDLPVLAYEDEPAPVRPYDDLDAEFSNLLQGMNAGVAEQAVQSQQPADRREIRIEQPASVGYFDDPAVPAVAGAAVAGAIAARAAAGGDYGYAYQEAPRAAAAGGRQDAGSDAQFAYDPDFDEEIAGPAYTQLAERPSRRRGLVIAAVVGGVALLGGVAAFALSYGEGPGSGELALVKADPSPVKIKPENPGGATIPNQDAKVYDSVAGAGGSGEPTQEKLLNSAEEPVQMPTPDDEPVDLAMQDDEAAAGQPAETAAAGPQAPAGQPMPKGADRIEQVIQDPGVDDSVEVAAVAPRKVRTMIVKADGTLVAREEPAPAAAPALDSASEGIVDPVASSPTPAGEGAETTATVPSAPQPAAAAAPQQPAATAPQQPAAAAPQARAAGTTPDRVPVAPARPSDQPVDIVGEVKAERVAALDPAAAPAPGSWSMQIASQPTEAAAQSSYQDLQRRYGSVLEGKQATIVKAEIAGKGTFWRVRVPAGSRNDAVKLCETYKAAGGSCFVSR
ncbi:SPOR domain-containing protein [Kumtagia ephedrae]|uniref:SPOR domain-containing protein n=1 Tax=Kumtagia ephedrae TaxID=2116701 RepID=A0A2P7ST57_9HYPH|nr:SPOR domain-containing protein [Mesorhizobium ephedrae]PSJ65672.1 hypothetical protein C7I84_00665 [Mesorhizobium ephedrae]